MIELDVCLNWVCDRPTDKLKNEDIDRLSVLGESLADVTKNSFCQTNESKPQVRRRRPAKPIPSDRPKLLLCRIHHRPDLASPIYAEYRMKKKNQDKNKK